MAEPLPPSDRRAQAICATGLILQLGLFAVVLVVGIWSTSDALIAGARHLLGGVVIWMALLIVFTQRKRSRVEDLETEQLRRAQESGLSTQIFDVGDETLLLERRRLNWTYRFLLPAFTILLIAYHIGGTFVWWGWPISRGIIDAGWSRASEPFVAMLFVAGSAFVCFVYARYILGMAHRPEWRMLRAGGGYMLGNALVMTLLVVATALDGNAGTAVWAEPAAAYAIRTALFLLGLEMLVNFVLEFYRPRHPDEEDVVPAFDSRLLASIGEPGGIARSIAETINYQFGFEVSGTWFYRAVQRAVFPLAMFTVVALFVLSAIVIVDADEQVIVERFGAPLQQAGQTLDPGFHVKLPWPIDRTVRCRVDQVREVVIGHGEEGEGGEGEEGAHEDGDEHAILWGEQHGFNPEMMLLVADRQAGVTASTPAEGDGETGQRRAARSVAVSILYASMLIEYRVSDLHRYAYRYQDPEAVLRSIAYQELSDYAAGVDLNVLMGPGRVEFGRKMRAVLRHRCEDMGLGIELTFVALQDAHPPSMGGVAGSFQNVVSEEVRKAARIEAAEGMAEQMLTLAAGSVERARALDDAILEMQRLRAAAEQAPDPETDAAAERATQEVTDLLYGNPQRGITPCSGAVAQALAQAKADRWRHVSEAEAKTLTFASDLAAYQTAPEMFKMRRYLEMLRQTLTDLRKFVITGDEPVIIEYQGERPATLDLEAEPR